MQPTTPREIVLRLEDVSLGGEFDVPQNALELVLFAHGSGSSRHSPRNQFVARVLREKRIGTLLFDLLTGEEEQADARTRQLRFDIPFLARRLTGATRWVLNEPTARDLNLGYFGASTGAAAALVAAATLCESIRAVVSRGGRPDLAGSALEKVQAPTLLLVGAQDEQVLELNEGAYNRLRCPKALRVIPGATHLFEESGTLDQVAKMASEWFAEHLKSRKTQG
jgi:pimeloyl-ACP methyl ester carboxylesterase